MCGWQAESNEPARGNCRHRDCVRMRGLILSAAAPLGLIFLHQPLPLAQWTFSAIVSFWAPDGRYLSACISGILPRSPHRPLLRLLLGVSLSLTPRSSGGCCSFGGWLIQLMEASVLCDQKAIAEIMSRVHQILYYSLPWQTGRLLKGITLSWGSRDEGKPAMWWMGEGGREQPRQREQLRKRL